MAKSSKCSKWNKKKLLETENEFISEIEGIWKDIGKALNIDKNLIEQINSNDKSQKKDGYGSLIKRFMGNKQGKKFIKSFPYWSHQLSKHLQESAHYRRLNADIAQMDSKTLQELFSEKNKILNLKTISNPSFFSLAYFKKLGKRFLKFFKGGISKTKLSKSFDEFFRKRNSDWCRWWELVAGQNSYLSCKVPKEVLNKIMNLPEDSTKLKRKALCYLINGDTEMEFSCSRPVHKFNINISNINPNTRNDNMTTNFIDPNSISNFQFNSDSNSDYDSIKELSYEDMSCEFIDLKSYTSKEFNSKTLKVGDKNLIKEIFSSLDQSLKSKLEKIL